MIYMKTFLKKPAVWLPAAMIVYSVVLSAISFLKYDLFLYNSFDLAIYNQTFWNTAHGNWFQITIHPGSYLGDHFELLIAPLSFAYAFFPSPKTLLFLQTLVVALGAIPAYFLAKHFAEKHHAPRWLVPFSVAVYLLNPFLWNMNLFEFHILPFAIPLLLTAALFYEKEKFFPYIFFLLLSLTVREDVALVIAMFGVLALLQKRSWRWVAAPLVIGGAWFFFATKMIGYFSPEGSYKFLYYYAWLGQSFGEMAQNIFLHPLRVLARFFTIGNLEMVAGFLMPFFFLPLARPKYLLLALLPFAEFVLGASGGGILMLETHYGALFLPAVFVAFFAALSSFFSSEPPVIARSFGGVLKKIGSKYLEFFPIFLGVAAVYGFAAFGPAMGIGDLWKRYDALWERSAEWRSMVSEIPERASVIASYEFLTPLSGRKSIYALNYVFIGKRQFSDQDFVIPNDIEYIIMNTHEFVVFDMHFPDTLWTAPWYESGDERIRRILEEGNFGVLRVFDDVVLWKRGAGSG